jgi:hypothetical protein
MERHEPTKIEWRGRILSIQVRATVWRYLLHNRTHREIGYTLFFHGDAPDRTGYFSVAISEKQQQNGQFRINDALTGTAWTKMYRETEYADYYRAGSLKRVANFGTVDEGPPPPWLIDPPPLETYSWRCARQLAIGRYKGECFQCVWANMSAVTIAWNFDTGLNKYRFESFCYGPKSCALYSMGKARGVSYKGRGTVYDTGDIDEDSTVHRDWDE